MLANFRAMAGWDFFCQTPDFMLIQQIICQLQRAENIMFLSVELGRDFDVMVAYLYSLLTASKTEMHRLNDSLFQIEFFHDYKHKYPNYED